MLETSAASADIPDNGNTSNIKNNKTKKCDVKVNKANKHANAMRRTIDNTHTTTRITTTYYNQQPTYHQQQHQQHLHHLEHSYHLANIGGSHHNRVHDSQSVRHSAEHNTNLSYLNELNSSSATQASTLGILTPSFPSASLNSSHLVQQQQPLRNHHGQHECDNNAFDIRQPSLDFRTEAEASPQQQEEQQQQHQHQHHNHHEHLQYDGNYENRIPINIGFAGIHIGSWCTRSWG